MKTTHNRIYQGIPLGLAVRGSIDNDRTFRVRRGNGSYTSIAGEVYQDQYAYFVPLSINNVQSEPYRRQWAAAIHKWRYDLSDDEKETYNVRARNQMHMSGYNLFIRLAMKGEISMFIDRGDPIGWDFVIPSWTTNGLWHSLNLSAIVPAGAKAVLLQTEVQSMGATDKIRFRELGNANQINMATCETLRAGIIRSEMKIVASSADRKIQYMADNIAWITINCTVRGWWT